MRAARLDAFAASRGPAWSAAAVALATLGCTVPGPKAQEQATQALRRSFVAGAPLNAQVSALVAGDPHGARLILVHGTPGSATGWNDYLLDPPPGMEVVALDRPGFGDSGPACKCRRNVSRICRIVTLLVGIGSVRKMR